MPEPCCELVSVVIPTRNRRPRLERAVESVCSQTWPNIEIIIVDDASSDDTQEYLKKLVNTGIAIQVICNHQAHGGAVARNQGLNSAKGAYVAFLDDDDIWLPEKIAIQISMLKQHPEASAVSCSFYIQNESGRRKVKHVFPTVDAQQLLNTNHLGGASMCLASREMLKCIGGFDAALPSGQDWDLWIRLNDRGPVLVCRNPLVCYMPHDEIRITSNHHSTYIGRRRIYLHYKKRMSSATRLHHLRELLFCRRVVLDSRPIRRVIALLKLACFFGASKSVRYFYRYLKI